MKIFCLSILALISALGTAQVLPNLPQGNYPTPGSAIDFSGINKLPVGPVVARGTDLYIGPNKVRFHIATLTDNACAPKDPVQTAKLLRSRGYNGVRLHHIDRGLREGWWTTAQIVSFMDALYANGIRVSIDLVSKRGETWLTGVDGYKLDLYEDRNNARADLERYVNSLQPILKHPGLYLVCLVNEGATVLRNNNSPEGAAAKARDFYDYGSKLVRVNGFTGLCTDLPDGAIDVPTFGPVAQNFDICTVHFYGGHPDTVSQTYFENSWCFEGWNWGTSVWYAYTSKRPVIVQEWGCLPFNPYRGANSAFLVAEMAQFDGEAQFCFASNQAFLDGNFDRTDWYNFSTDYPRMVSDVFASMVNQYNGPRIDYFWGHMTPPESKNYRFQTSKISLSVTDKKAKAIVFQTATKAYVFLWDETSIRGFDSEKAGEMRRVVQIGTKEQLSFRPSAVSVKDGYRVTSAYETDPWTGLRTATCSLSGDGFLPSNGCGVFEVNLKKK